MGNAQTRQCKENRRSAAALPAPVSTAATATATRKATPSSFEVIEGEIAIRETNLTAAQTIQTGEQQQQRNPSPKSIFRKSFSKLTTITNTTATITNTQNNPSRSSPAEEQHRATRQFSTWSWGSLSDRGCNSSFSATARNSFRHRNKSTRKSVTSLHSSRRLRTTWHKPLTNAIFSTHFRESTCNEHFHIDLLVAKGAFGIVFKVREKLNSTILAEQTTNAITTTKCYALKVLKKSKVIEENSVQQIKDEADIQKVCGHHPFIVQQIDLWQNRHNLHILCEYMPNGELFSKIAHFTVDLVRLYVAEIALALDFLHNAGIIYRDAKPENILLTENYHIKLTDFGLSKWLKLGATTNTMCGTFKYMAPEILRGEAYGHSVDWWALGVIVCQMFTQKSPNIKRYLASMLKSHSPHSPIPRDNINNTVDAAVAAAGCVGADAAGSVDGDDDGDAGSAAAVAGVSKVPSIANIMGCLVEPQDYLPKEVEHLSHEAKDVIKRLLELDARQRIHSVLSLQRIALYKGFKIDAKHLLSISPLEIIARDHIRIYKDHLYEEVSSEMAYRAFQRF